MLGGYAVLPARAVITLISSSHLHVIHCALACGMWVLMQLCGVSDPIGDGGGGVAYSPHRRLLFGMLLISPCHTSRDYEEANLCGLLMAAHPSSIASRA